MGLLLGWVVGFGLVLLLFSVDVVSSVVLVVFCLGFVFLCLFVGFFLGGVVFFYLFKSKLMLCKRKP